MKPLQRNKTMTLLLLSLILPLAIAITNPPKDTYPKLTTIDNNKHQCNTPLGGEESILKELQEAFQSDHDLPNHFPAKTASDFSSSIPKQQATWKFLSTLSSSPTFRTEFWHKRPLVIRQKNTGGWISRAFTYDKDMKTVLPNSFISGHRTADSLRRENTTDSNPSWDFLPLKKDMTKRTTWEEVEEGLNGGTIYFNTAGGLWPNLGALCRLTQSTFGIPSNVNVYVTPPLVKLSVPPHTDKQDVFVYQTSGAKRWRVYNPPNPRKRGVDPLSRGKYGDIISGEELGEPIVDTVIREGDFMYIPVGFPHTTDTCTIVDGGGTESSDSHEEIVNEVFNDISIHLTMGLDTHVFYLTYAHLRWCLLSRLKRDYNILIESDELLWESMETLPIGFLSTKSVSSDSSEISPREEVATELKRIMRKLEPNRWKDETGLSSHNPNDDEKEDFPPSSEIYKVIDYFFDTYLVKLLEVQDEMFRDIDPHDEETMVKTFLCTQKQNAVMEEWGEFSGNEAVTNSFRQRRLAGEKVSQQLK